MIPQAAKSINGTDVGILRELIRERTGIWIPERDLQRLEGIASVLIPSSGLQGWTAYLARLAADEDATGPLWRALIGHLTVPETFFSRDQAQLDAIEHQILPELIARNRDTRALRIWSAGCATGEEAYSLAMAVRRHLKPDSGWKVLILGTDLNDTYLGRARSGVFTQWSFRRMSVEERALDFEPAHGGWRISPELRRMVTFQHGNLVLDRYPDEEGQLHDMDLILCRNVFIYFDRSATADVLQKMTSTLRPGGFLITGHTELVGQDLQGLENRGFPGAMAHQRVPVHVTETASQGASVAEPEPLRIRRQARPHPRPSTPVTLADGLPREPSGLSELLIAGEAAANAGAYADARALAERAVALDEFAHEPYLLLATVAELEGETRRARGLLDQALYLEPSSIPAYLTLAALHHQEGNDDRARVLWHAGLDLLKRLNPEDRIPPLTGTPARVLMSEITSLLGVSA
ncbi:MAG: CheR family methyltransferase [Actinomycetes bacterium]